MCILFIYAYGDTVRSHMQGHKKTHLSRLSEPIRIAFRFVPFDSIRFDLFRLRRARDLHFSPNVCFPRSMHVPMMHIRSLISLSIPFNSSPKAFQFFVFVFVTPLFLHSCECSLPNFSQCTKIKQNQTKTNLCDLVQRSYQQRCPIIWFSSQTE